ncbi:MAG: glycosyltransferase family A protein, partial [bacterium]|nr:glycosyltransferase family A protein [bacterium]
MSPKISVIVPAYNAASDLPKMIEALRIQTKKPLEYILVDDCSTDNSKKIAEKFFKVYTTPKNSGPAAARNLGMKVAKGDYFAFLDSDCLPQSDWFERIENCLILNKESVITGSYYVKACTVMGQAIAAQGFPCGGAIGFDKMWQVSPEGYVEKISTGNFIIKRSVIEEHGGFDEDFSYCFEDAWFTHKLTTAGIKIKYCPEIEVEHAAREDFKSFIKWHYSRGRGLKPFKERMG